MIEFSAKTQVMGILNCTPDSFFPGSRKADGAEAVDAAMRMIEAGADIIDVGGESTRPGSDPVPQDVEAARVVPVIKAIREGSRVLVSVDTSKAAVAEKALDAGADIVNDVTALRGDAGMARLIAHRAVPVVLMHMRGTPKSMQEAPRYENIIAEIMEELAGFIRGALEAGISRDMIIVDPGIGFGKRLQDNLRIIRELGSFSALGFPVLVGLSRKRFIGDVLGLPVEGRLTGTIAANVLAAVNGADILRVHDVAETVEALRLVDAVGRAGN